MRTVVFLVVVLLGCGSAAADPWAAEIGAHGAPGPAMRAWCKAHPTDAKVELVPGVTREVHTRTSSCGLYVTTHDQATIDAIVRRIDAWDSPIERDVRQMWIDEPDHLVASVSRLVEHGDFDIQWHPYVAMDKIVGTAKQPLAGIDLAALLGATDDQVRAATHAPYRVEACDATACEIFGPSPPGGFPVEVRAKKVDGKVASVVAMISVLADDRTALRERLAKLVAPPYRVEKGDLGPHLVLER